MKLSDFNWGNSSEEFKESVENEVFNIKTYECVYIVRKNDVVVDIGASIGPFVFSIQDRAKKVYALEPSKDAANTLEINSKGFPVEVIRAAIGSMDGEIEFDMECHTVGSNIKKSSSHNTRIFSLTFMSFVKFYNIDYIDFLKIDCEGGEYQIFRDENMRYLLNNVRNIVCEFHMATQEGKARFRHFRDVYLKRFRNYEIRSVDGVDIKWDLFNEHFFEYYREFLIHIEN